MARSESNRAGASGYESRSDMLSGVVTSTLGKRSFCFLRTDCLVSEVRSSTDQFRPIAAMAVVRASTVSDAKARSGVIQSKVSDCPVARVFNPCFFLFADTEGTG